MANKDVLRHEKSGFSSLKNSRSTENVQHPSTITNENQGINETWERGELDKTGSPISVYRSRALTLIALSLRLRLLRFLGTLLLCRNLDDNLLNAPAGCLNLCPGAGRELMRAHMQRPVQFTIAQYLEIALRG